LTDFASAFGANNPLVKKVLAGKWPHERAVELVSGTKRKDAAAQKDLYGRDAAGLQSAHDPMIDFRFTSLSALPKLCSRRLSKLVSSWLIKVELVVDVCQIRAGLLDKALREWRKLCSG
jgi:hypothetical protein